MIWIRRSFLALALAVPLSAQADDYSDPDYLRYDLDNMARTTERQGFHATSASYGAASADTFTRSFLAGMIRQAEDAPEGRIYAGGGQVLPGGNVGDPENYDKGERTEVSFTNREGTKLIGNVWPCQAYVDAKAAGEARPACPTVIITTGSIQVTQHMYGWLTRWLQMHGYTIFTYDVRGQGESETTRHPDGNPWAPIGEPANPQDGANFQAGTVDAIRFVLSDANPERDSVDENHLGLVGHSAGAGAVATVQRCSNAYPSRQVADEELPAVCGGERWAIQTIVAYDGLGSTTPVVPAFNHIADGYFVNAVPTMSAPDPDGRLGSFDTWREAGVDILTISVRGGTHAEWSQIPYIVGATRYGVPQSAYYTLAWFDRFLHPDPARNQAGYDAIASGPIPAEAAGAHHDWRASLFSVKSKSAAFVTHPSGGTLDERDLRAYARAQSAGAVVAVGDWAGAVAENEHGTTFEQGVAHGALYGR